MLTITKDKPIVTFIYEESMTLEDANQYTSKLDRVTAREEPFAVLAIVFVDNRQNRDQGVNKAISNWLKHNKPKLDKFCFGYVTVTSSSAVFTFYKLMTQLIGFKMMSVPVMFFSPRMRCSLG